EFRRVLFRSMTAVFEPAELLTAALSALFLAVPLAGGDDDGERHRQEQGAQGGSEQLGGFEDSCHGPMLSHGAASAHLEGAMSAGSGPGGGGARGLDPGRRRVPEGSAPEGGRRGPEGSAPDDGRRGPTTEGAGQRPRIDGGGRRAASRGQALADGRPVV